LVNRNKPYTQFFIECYKKYSFLVNFASSLLLNNLV